MKALYKVNFLSHDLQCIGWGDLAKGLRGSTGVHAGSSHLISENRLGKDELGMKTMLENSKCSFYIVFPKIGYIFHPRRLNGAEGARLFFKVHQVVFLPQKSELGPLKCQSGLLAKLYKRYYFQPA